MARAALQWSLEQAGDAAGVSRRTILRFENDHRDIQPELIAAIRCAYQVAGVRFIQEAPTLAASSRRRSGECSLASALSDGY